MKRHFTWAAQLLVSAALLALFCLVLPVPQLWDTVCRVPLQLSLAVLAVFILGQGIAGFKWWWLLAPHDTIPLRVALRAHYAGLLANLCLPGVAGGDVVRAGWVMRLSDARTGLGVASLADRLLDCLALLTLAVAGALWTASVAGVIGYALLLSGVMLFLGGIAGGLLYLIVRRRPADSRAGQLATALRVLVKHPGLLLQSFLLSLLVQSTFVGLNVSLGRAAGVEVPLGAWFVAWPLAKLVATVPISLGGIGVREGAIVLLLRPFGASAVSVTGASLLWRALLTLGSLIAGLVATTLLGSPEPRKEPSLP